MTMNGRTFRCNVVLHIVLHAFLWKSWCEDFRIVSKESRKLITSANVVDFCAEPVIFERGKDENVALSINRCPLRSTRSEWAPKKSVPSKGWVIAATINFHWNCLLLNEMVILRSPYFLIWEPFAAWSSKFVAKDRVSFPDAGNTLTRAYVSTRKRRPDRSSLS